MTGATLEVTGGARHAEARLLEELRRLRDEAREDPRVLARPVRIVVPSRSLRLHLGERIARTLGSIAGVELQTLHGLALGLLERAGVPAPSGDALVEVLSRRLARDEPPLREAFEPFVDGYRTVAGTVRDLLDAGFEPALAEALVERIEELPHGRRPRARAAAVVRTAARVAEELARRGVGGRSELLRRARTVLEEEPDRALPTRALFVHGFADATGCASDLLETLVRRLPDARVFLDAPPDPAEPGREDAGARFVRRLRERLEGATGPPAVRDGDPPAAAPPTLLRAPGPDAEVRAVALRIRELVAEGTAPERVGVVARDLAGYRTALRVQFERLGVPSSAMRLRAPLDGAGRRIVALVELLESGDDTPADRWLDAQRVLTIGEGDDALTLPPSADLRLGLRVLGAGRLRDVAELDVDALVASKRIEDGTLPLPVRHRVSTGEADPERNKEAIGFHARRMKLRVEELSVAVAAARAVRRRLSRWAKRATLREHLDELDALRTRDLRWGGSDVAEKRVAGGLVRPFAGFPDEELTLAELVLLVRRALLPIAAPPLWSGSEGGGVAVLDAMEARGRTFDHLFVLGLNRDVFPRVGREDPLLPDDVRRPLAELLPDVPIAARARSEDRYLFAQLVSSSPNVQLSWQVADADGKPRVVSPLVERVLGDRSDTDVPLAPRVFPLAPEELDGPRTAGEHAVLGGLFAQEDGFQERLELALAESTDLDDVARRKVAKVRTAVRAAFEDRDATRLVPWLGFVGAHAEVGIRPDPREEALSVTRFEAVARCPWQGFLRRLLSLEAAPDPLDQLPGLEARVVGNVVHNALEAIVDAQLGDADKEEPLPLARALGREAVELEWPDGAGLDRLLEEKARKEIGKEREPLPGLVKAVATVAREHVERARAFFEDEQRNWPGSGVLGAEVAGEARVATPAGEVRLTFRADRLDRREGAAVLTDYKTGKPTEEKDLSAKIAQGTALQPLTYMLGALQSDALVEKDVRGRYLFTKAEEPEGMALGMSRTVDRYRPFYESAVSALVQGWLDGTFVPRLLVNEREPDTCKYCDVAAACVRGDSGARAALVEIVEGTTDIGDPGPAAKALWQLGAAKGEDRGKKKRGRKS